VKKVPFKVIIEDQFNTALKIDPPTNGVDFKGDHFETEDEKWVKEYEIIGVLVRLDRKLEETLKLTIIKPTNPLDQTLYKFSIDLGIDSGTIYLPENDIFNFRKFAIKYYSTFKKVLPPTSSDKWREILNRIGQHAKVVISEDESNPVISAVINYIESARVVKTKEEMLVVSPSIYIEDKKIYAWGGGLERIADKYHISMSKLRFYLNNYLAENSKRMRIGRSLYYVWVFDAAWFKTKDPEEDD